MFGKALIILVSAITLGGIMLSFSINENVLETEERLAKDEVEILARNASLAGLSRAQQKFWDDVRSRADGTFATAMYTGTLDGYAYKATIGTSTRGADFALLQSRGYGITVRGDTMDFDSQAEYHISFTGAGSQLPEEASPLEEAVNSACDISLDGSSKITGSQNANVHTNGLIETGGNGAPDGKGVFGYGMIGSDPSSLTFQNSTKEDKFYSFFKPNDATGYGTVIESDPIGENQFNALITQVMNVYRESADVVVGLEPPSEPDGKVYYDDFDEINWDEDASASNLFIIHHVGDLTLHGGEMPPYTVFVVDGDVTLNGNTTIGEGGSEDMSNIAIYIDGDLVKGNGNVEMWGQFFMTGTYIKGNGNFTLNGNIAAKCEDSGELDLSGNFTLNYYPANPLLTGVAPTLNIERVAHSEW